MWVFRGWAAGNQQTALSSYRVQLKEGHLGMSLGADLFQSSPLFLTPSLFFPLTSPSPTFWPHSVIGFVPLYFAILPDHGPETKVPTDYWTEIAKKHGQSKSCLLSRFPLVVPMQRGYASTNLSLILERRLSWETYFSISDKLYYTYTALAISILIPLTMCI